MPVRRRHAKRRAQGPDAVEALRHGWPVEATEENRNLLIGAYFFNNHPDLSPAALKRAIALVKKWHGLILP